MKYELIAKSINANYSIHRHGDHFWELLSDFKKDHSFELGFFDSVIKNKTTGHVDKIDFNKLFFGIKRPIM